MLETRSEATSAGCTSPRASPRAGKCSKRSSTGRAWMSAALMKSEPIASVVKSINLQSDEDLFAAIGNGHVPAAAIAHKLQGEAPQPPEATIIETAKPSGERALSVSLDGLDTLKITRAKCCMPLPGEEVVGYITRGKGVALHSLDCPNLAALRRRRAGASAPHQLDRVQRRAIRHRRPHQGLRSHRHSQRHHGDLLRGQDQHHRREGQVAAGQDRRHRSHRGRAGCRAAQHIACQSREPSGRNARREGVGPQSAKRYLMQSGNPACHGRERNGRWAGDLADRPGARDTAWCRQGGYDQGRQLPRREDREPAHLRGRCRQDEPLGAGRWRGGVGCLAVHAAGRLFKGPQARFR